MPVAIEGNRMATASPRKAQLETQTRKLSVQRVIRGRTAPLSRAREGARAISVAANEEHAGWAALSRRWYAASPSHDGVPRTQSPPD